MMMWNEAEGAMSEVTMPFGKHYGELVSELPDSYIIWLTTKADIQSERLREAIEAEGNYRVGQGSIRASDL